MKGAASVGNTCCSWGRRKSPAPALGGGSAQASCQGTVSTSFMVKEKGHLRWMERYGDAKEAREPKAPRPLCLRAIVVVVGGGGGVGGREEWQENKLENCPGDVNLFYFL